MDSDGNQSGHFLPVLAFIACTTVVCIVSATVLTLMTPESDPARYAPLIATFTETFKFCVAAVVGMIGGHSLSRR